jgi:DNA replication factor GINS
LETQDLVKVHTIGYTLEDVKVEFLHDLKVNVSGTNVEGKATEIINIPRWIADILSSEKHVKIHDKDMITELKQAKVKEVSQGDYNLSTLDKNFFIRLKAYMKTLENNDFNQVESMLKELVRIREGKIITLANSSKLTTEISNKLTVEELSLFEQIHQCSENFKDQIFGGKK